MSKNDKPADFNQIEYAKKTTLKLKKKPPVQVLLSLLRSKPSEHKHLGPDFVLTHMCWQFSVEHGSVNGKHCKQYLFPKKGTTFDLHLKQPSVHMHIQISSQAQFSMFFKQYFQ